MYKKMIREKINTVWSNRAYGLAWDCPVLTHSYSFVHNLLSAISFQCDTDGFTPRNDTNGIYQPEENQPKSTKDKQRFVAEIGVKSKKISISKVAINLLKSQQRYVHSCWRGFVVLFTGVAFYSAAVAKKPLPCDCTEVKLEPSKNRIEIACMPEINQTLKALDASEPTQATSRKKILTTAGTPRSQTCCRPSAFSALMRGPAWVVKL